MDKEVVREAGQHHYGKLLETGVRNFEYHQTVLHAKVMIADGWANIGSGNLGTRDDDVGFRSSIPGDGRRWQASSPRSLPSSYASDATSRSSNGGSGPVRIGPGRRVATPRSSRASRLTTTSGPSTDWCEPYSWHLNRNTCDSQLPLLAASAPVGIDFQPWEVTRYAFSESGSRMIVPGATEYKNPGKPAAGVGARRTPRTPGQRGLEKRPHGVRRLTSSSSREVLLRPSSELFRPDDLKLTGRRAGVSPITPR